MKNNYAQLKNEADIEQVVHYLGLPVFRKGAAFFIHCPIPGHNDEHPSNCYFKQGWSNVFCMACNQSINAIDLIMFVSGVSFGEAADILWELEGRPDWYHVKDWKKSKAMFNITREEAELLGIHFPNRVLFPLYLSDEKPHDKNKVIDRRELDGYLVCKVEHFTYLTFTTENQFRAIVRNKAYETLEKYKNDAMRCEGELKDIFFDMMERCINIIQKCK